MSIVLIVTYILATGGAWTVVYPMESFAQCYKNGAKIVALTSAESVSFKCRILHIGDEV